MTSHFHSPFSLSPPLLIVHPPFDRNNTEYMISVGLNLLTVALEVGSDALAAYPALLALVKDSLCQNLFSVSPTLLVPSTLSPTLD